MKNVESSFDNYMDKLLLDKNFEFSENCTLKEPDWFEQGKKVLDLTSDFNFEEHIDRDNIRENIHVTFVKPEKIKNKFVDKYRDYVCHRVSEVLPETIKDFRKELGMSRTEFAKVIGIPYSILNNVENGRAALTYVNLYYANLTFNSYIKQNNLNIKDNAFGLCLLGAIEVNDIYKPMEPILSVDTSNSMTNFSPDHEKLCKTFDKLSEIDRAKIMERMDYIISTYEDTDLIPTKRIAVLGQTACGNPIEALSVADEFIETNELKANFALRAVGNSMSPLIDDGDMILIKQTEELEVGDVGIFQINNTGFSVDEEVTCKLLKSIKDGVMTLVPLNPAHDPVIVDAKKHQVKIIGKYLGKA